ncbi:methionine--tRNA ligase [Pontibacter sp. BT310]|uniref:Methionine--tRNA ligase n=1 Tax=Pontibacter populi TaxID=890055 RepID=A0ABS6XD96_9BACT|nr:MULTISPECIES: methionine--tRNA ligase [Pontibacter]MBJ6118765.1 methionine--tRNA ligase [Pontibacter sp. BT310]MBR0571194.1 methionine--tRNA ligase [Microvirga sp. STS03]MBW3365619.1 methionine--tRNA ligase [Pontibacter populi]
MTTTTPKRYTVTAALPYANGPVHIGHLAGVYLPADIYVRYLRLQNRDVKFICGSDEHGVPITIRAKKEGITPQQAVDKYHELIKQSFADFNISFDIYDRTSSKIHHETASDFFLKLYNDGKFLEQTTQQYYDEKAQQFLADRYIVGTCPKCGNENAYGDQCESCGTSLNATDLINPKSTLSGAVPVMRETKHWYLPLNEYEPWLREWIVEGHKGDWKPNVYGQCKSWIDQGLQPRAVTRDLDWGVPVPVPGGEGKVLYVWFDAPIGYISATKALTPDWEKYWKDEETKLVHFIGKDNIVFHCIIFPSMLKAHGDYILPDNVPANEFLNLEGDKISTSRNWAVWLHEYLEDFKGKGDVLRYALCANAPETKDNDFTWKDYQARNNNELLAILGNFINRAVVLTQKYYNGAVPTRNELTDYDKVVLEDLNGMPMVIAAHLERYKFRDGLGELMNLARLGNKYLADTEPWKLIKTDEERVKTIMNIALQISASLAILMEPFLPDSAAKLRAMLNMEAGMWADAGAADLLKDGHVIGTPALLFERVEDTAVEAQVQKLLDTKKANEIANSVTEPAKENISFEEFSKMDIRIGTILAAEKVAKTKKLLKLTIDTGIDQRTVVSGIAEFFNPDEIVGQQVSILVNLAPRDIKGITSQGMILMAENADGSLAFVQPSVAVKNGGTVS